MTRFYSIKFSLRTTTPRALDVRVTPLVFCFREGALELLEPVDERELAASDNVLFDKKFGDTIRVTYVDLVSGEYVAKVLTYNVPEEAKLVIELIKSEGDIERRYVLLYAKRDSSYERVLSAPLSDLALREIARVASVCYEVLKPLTKY